MSYWAGTAHPPTGASQDELEKHAKTKAHRVLAALWDLRWHKTATLLSVGGHRFGAAVLILRKSGWDIETETYKRADGRSDFRYKLNSHDPGPSEGSLVRIYADAHDVEQAAAGVLTSGMEHAAREALT